MRAGRSPGFGATIALPSNLSNREGRQWVVSHLLSQVDRRHSRGGGAGLAPEATGSPVDPQLHRLPVTRTRWADPSEPHNRLSSNMAGTWHLHFYLNKSSFPQARIRMSGDLFCEAGHASPPPPLLLSKSSPAVRNLTVDVWQWHYGKVLSLRTQEGVRTPHYQYPSVPRERRRKQRDFTVCSQQRRGCPLLCTAYSLRIAHLDVRMTGESRIGVHRLGRAA